MVTSLAVGISALDTGRHDQQRWPFFPVLHNEVVCLNIDDQTTISIFFLTGLVDILSLSTLYFLFCLTWSVDQLKLFWL